MCFYLLLQVVLCFLSGTILGMDKEKQDICIVIEIIFFSLQMKLKQVHADPDLTFIQVVKQSFQVFAIDFCMDDTESLWDQQR